MKIKKRYDTPETHAISFEGEKSLVDPSFEKDANINNIMAKYIKTGQLPELRNTLPQFGDFSAVMDYKDSLDFVRTAEDSFQQLPAKIRERFHNDPAALISFMGDEKNLEEAIKLGLVNEPIQTRKENPIPTSEAIKANDDSTTITPKASDKT